MNGLIIFTSTVVVLQIGIFGFLLRKKTSVWQTYVDAWKCVGALIFWFFKPFFSSKK